MKNDLWTDGQALITSRASSRRGFILGSAAAGLGAGFAVASGPVLGQAIKTDLEGIAHDEIRIASGGSDIPAYVARPAKATAKLSTILVISEIFGVHEHIADVCRRLAKLGYLAIAPNLFARAGDPTAFGTIAEIQSNIVAKTPDRQVLGDLKSCLAWATANGGDAMRAGITGFCWGGRITWLACAQLEGLTAGVAWYGRLTGDKSDNFPLHPIDIAAALKAPVLGLYGGKDTGIPLESVEAMRTALMAPGASASARQSRIEVYPDAPHAFHADYRASYRAGPAADGWAKMQSWFKQHGL
ncbi:MAG: dienelactone hydrolase family protein [Burkholderiaceae bacterium]|nr:dienelactone hydrolase family protein [Burkholderiaceae bacterium]